MRTPDINRLNRAADHIEAALVHLEKVYENTESWQKYGTGQHLTALREELSSLKNFSGLMKKDQTYQHRDWEIRI